MEEFCKFMLENILQDTIKEIIVVNSGKIKINQVSYKPSFNERFKEKVLINNKASSKTTLSDVSKRLIFFKLENDIDFIRQIIEETVTEVSQHGTINKLAEIVEKCEKEDRDEFKIIEDYEKNSNLCVYLEKKFKREQLEGEKNLKELDERIINLESQLKNCEIENSMRTRLVFKWETTRHQQANTVFEKETKNLNDIMAIVKIKKNREKRIIHEIDVYSENEFNKLEKEIQFWIEKYNNEIATLQNNLKLTQSKIDASQQTFKDIQQLFDERKEQIEIYLKQKRLEEESRKLEELKWNSAVRIQAWWRGTMVRNCLGPFRRKKRGKKGKKGASAPKKNK